jgi:hypothetical protein
MRKASNVPCEEGYKAWSMERANVLGSVWVADASGYLKRL